MGGGGMLEDGGMIMKIWFMWMDERQIEVSNEITATRKYTRDGNIWQEIVHGQLSIETDNKEQ